MVADMKSAPIRYVALDSLRGLCACMVVLYHFESQSHFNDLAFIQGGWLFVDFFFVLSGFVIATSYGTRLAEGFPIGRFMWLRLGRIYPLHVAVLIVFLLFEFAFATLAPGFANRRPFTGDFSLDGWFYMLGLVQIFFGSGGAIWNGPSWSIAAEMWTYVIFALLLRFASRFTLPICLAIAAVAPVILFFLTDRYLHVFHESGAMVRALFGFSLGVVGWYLTPWVKNIALGSRRMDTAVEVALLGIVVWYVSTCAAGPTNLAAPFLFLITVLIFARERGVLSSLLLTRPFERLGTLSYSIYLIHVFLLYRFINGMSVIEKVTGFDAADFNGTNTNVGGGAWFSDAMTIVFLAVVIGMSELTYRFVEKPGQAFSRRPIKLGAVSPLPVAPVVSEM